MVWGAGVGGEGLNSQGKMQPGLCQQLTSWSLTALPWLAPLGCCLIRFYCASPAEPHAQPAPADVFRHGSWAPTAAGSRGACSGTRQQPAGTVAGTVAGARAGLVGGTTRLPR